jgi:CPA2 family monovalent cation:H+ antiporter-2
VLVREVIGLLTVATAGLVVGRALGLPSIVAYLAAGVLVGPGGLGWVERSNDVEELADLGVALLLFGVGIEFSLDRLRRILGRMVASGGLQVGLTIPLTAVMFHAIGASWPSAVFAGFLVALSSTAIVFKLLTEDGTIDAPEGQAAAAMLLFQDLALVPMMLLVPVLAHPGAGMATGAGLALARAAGALGLLLLLARTVLPRAVELVGRLGTSEAFPLTALVLAFGTALAATWLGLSLPIGAFLAGLALSGSRYAQQVFAELLPLRDAFVAVFFTSIGLLLQPATLAAEPLLLAAMIAAVLLKGLLAGTITGLLWHSTRLAIMTGLGLAQIGEFSFVLARQGSAAGVLPPVYEQAFLGAAVLTMAATPFLLSAARRLGRLESGSAGRASDLRDHVLVLGCGTTGTAVARVLTETGVPFVALDMDARAGDSDIPVRFGDATRRAVLEEIGAARARAAVVTVGDPVGTRRIVALVRQLNREARILVRAQRVAEIDELERLGADEVVPSEFETSIELFVRLLTHLGVPRHVVRLQESLIRVDHYQALRGVAATPELLTKTRELIAGGIIERAQVMEGSEAAGKTLAELQIRSRTGATVLSLVRGEKPLPVPDGTTRLEAGDLLVLFGPHEAIDRAVDLFDPR